MIEHFTVFWIFYAMFAIYMILCLIFLPGGEHIDMSAWALN